MGMRGRKAEPIVYMPKTILVEMKRCTVCNEYRELSEYDEEKRTSNGLRAYCKECRRKMANEKRKNARASSLTG